MPRPKSELTQSGRAIGIRLTEWEYQEWKKIGGTKWLRGVLKNQRMAMINIYKEDQDAVRKQTQTIQERI